MRVHFFLNACFRASIREERTWAIAIETVLREPKFRTEFPYFSREKRSEFRRKRDLYEPLLTAMAQVLPALNLRPRQTQSNLGELGGVG